MKEWSKETYEASLSSRCWWAVHYTRGWDACDEIQHDKELQALVDIEESLSPVPDWAREIVERTIRFPPACPHYAFPKPLLEITSAIGQEKAQDFVHGCYTVDSARKRRASGYLFCLDAWLHDAEPEQASRELKSSGAAPIDWDQVCRSIWNVLGERTELKRMLVDRTLHRYRWWIKSCVWDDNASDDLCSDQYLGDLPRGGSEQHYGNPGIGDPWHAELKTAYVKEVEAKLAKMCPEWEWFRTAIHETWLCGPKTFRFLERLLWSIGKEKPSVSLPNPRFHVMAEDMVPGFLQCEDTYPDREESVTWLHAFHLGLKLWVRNDFPGNDVQRDVYNRLGERTPLKSWLVRLFIRNVELMKMYGEILNIV
jgi:hypothetical protein